MLPGDIDQGDARDAKLLYQQGKLQEAKQKSQRARNMLVEKNVIEGLCREKTDYLGTFLSRADIARIRQTWLSSPAQGGDI